MKITSVTLEHFRNIESLTLTPSPRVTVIAGKNGQGKTNLLESLWLCTGAKTFRGGSESDFLPLGKEGIAGRISLCYEAEGREQTVDIRLGEERETLHNKVKLAYRSQLAGRFLAIVFSPDDLSLVKSAPALRRRFMDTAICQLYPAYLGLLRRYQKSLSQRNALLKDLYHHPELEGLLAEWDETMAAAGEQIEGYRQRFSEKLRQEAAAVYDGISGSREVLTVTYKKGRDETVPYRQALAESRRQDLFTKTTNTGVHRDDLVLELGGVSARLYGSQGQQRSCVLALKLAEARLMEEITGQYPVILLDDVMSELDEERRRYVFEKTRDFQVMITCCEPDEVMKSAGSAARFVMEGGRLL